MAIGNLEVRGQKVINGFHIGNIHAHAGAVLLVNGFVIGNLIAEAGSKTVISGFLIGNVIQRGGVLEVGRLHIGNTIDRRDGLTHKALSGSGESKRIKLSK